MRDHASTTGRTNRRTTAVCKGANGAVAEKAADGSDATGGTAAHTSVSSTSSSSSLLTTLKWKRRQCCANGVVVQ